MTAKQIIQCWAGTVLRERQQNRVFVNTFFDGFEADILEITKSGYSYEYEVKISRADFKNDEKKQKHGVKKHYKIFNNERVNYFYYLVPEGLITVDEIPSFAGLIYAEIQNCKLQDMKGIFYEDRLFLHTVKTAPRLSREKFSEANLMKCYEGCYFKLHAKNAIKREYINLNLPY